MTGGNLRLDPARLLEVALDGQQHADGVVVCGAQYERCAALGKRHQQAVGVAQAVCVGYDCRNVVQWHLPQFLALSICVLHHHEPTVHEQVTPVIGHLDDAADHIGYSLKPGSLSSPMGDMVTRRAFAF